MHISQFSMAHPGPRSILFVNPCGCVTSEKPEYRRECAAHAPQRVHDTIEPIATELMKKCAGHRPQWPHVLLRAAGTEGILHPCGCVVLKANDTDADGIRDVAQHHLCDRHLGARGGHACCVTLFAACCRACCVMVYPTPDSQDWGCRLAFCAEHTPSGASATAIQEFAERELTIYKEKYSFQPASMH
jgi:hypothetical protein